MESQKAMFEQYPNQIACERSEPEKLQKLPENYLHDAIILVHAHDSNWIMEEINPRSKVHYPVCMTKSGYGKIWQHRANE
jgi:hypothetical protein